MTSESMQATVVPRSTAQRNRTTVLLSLFGTDGSPLTVPKQIAARADDVALTSTVAAGATPTKAEFDALRTDVDNLRTVVNDLLAKMRTAGILAP
jgi:hypothetical protein